MSSTTDWILNGQHGFAAGHQAKMVDITKSGQQGYMPDLTVYNANQNYVKKNMVAILVQAPLGFQDLPDPEMWVEALKAMVERHATRIEGLRSTLNVEWVESIVNGGGEMQQDVGKVTRERSEPSFTWPEKRGKPFKALLEGWIYNLLGDPNNQIPMVVTRGLTTKPNMLPQYTGMTVLFFEPDITHTEVIEAWLCTNMMPNTSGPIEGVRDLQGSGELTEINVVFSAITQHGYAPRKFAQSILDNLNLAGINPNLAPAFVDEVSATVDKYDNGYLGQIAAASSDFETV